MADPPTVNVLLDGSVSAAGVYANGALIWDTAHEFTVDFTAPLSPETPDLIVVARVRIPVGAMFEIIRRMSEHIGKHETRHGRLTPPPFELSPEEET